MLMLILFDIWNNTTEENEDYISDYDTYGML